MGWMADEAGLERRAANHVALTPLSHLRRGADLFADRVAIIHNGRTTTYRDYHGRICRLASALTALGIRPGDVVATLLPNVQAQAEAHFAIPACGAIINTINFRLEQDTVSYILGHGGAKVLLVDTAFLPLAEAAIGGLAGHVPAIVEVPDEGAGFPATGRYPTYEAVLAGGEADFAWQMPGDEWESLALNYTSGTTGRPKGVVYHHRGAYLMTMATAVAWQMPSFPVYLAIVPLFHCNGWNHVWMLPMIGGIFVCNRDVTAARIYAAIADHGVTHMGGAPIVLNMLVNAAPADRRPLPHTVRVLTAGAPPAAATLAAIAPLGFDVMQVYGLTETYGHVTQTLWQGDRWDTLPDDDRFAIQARTGVSFPMMEDIFVGAADGAQVARDGAAIGEILIRGNSVMKGYYRDPAATEAAFAGGHFHSGDLAVCHDDGYIRIVDRAKDIIISGGENISSVEIEGVLMRHPAVMLAAVVAMKDDKWGEVPCAFLELKPGNQTDDAAIVTFCRQHLAGFKVPKRVIFRTLPKTATGKIQKFELRRSLPG
jgi:fatty-acyl-CoA synthase